MKGALIEYSSFIPTLIRPESSLKGTVSRELRWVLLYINRKLFSRAIVAHHNFFYFIKRTLYNQQKKIQHMNGSTILDAAVFVVTSLFLMDKHTRISLFATVRAAKNVF